MWEERALRLRGSLTELASAGTGIGELYGEALRLVDPVVRSDLACWASLDPQNLAITSMTSGTDRIPVEYEPVLAEIEYAPEEPSRFAALAARGQGMLRASDLAAAERARSPRFARVWEPLGIDRELRFLFLQGGVCWGAAGLVRTGTDFTDREMDFLCAIAPALAAATRVAARAASHGPFPGIGPAVVVVTPEGRLQSLTAGAMQWRDRIEAVSPGQFPTMMQVMAAGSRLSPTAEFCSRVREVDGWWVLLRASQLVGEEELTAVVLEPATGRQALDLVLAAHGLTARERTVCEEVLTGRTTSEIAEHLFISTNTVQDHLTSIFAKCGVRSRGKLAALLQQQLPAQEQAPAAPARLGAAS